MPYSIKSVFLAFSVNLIFSSWRCFKTSLMRCEWEGAASCFQLSRISLRVKRPLCVGINIFNRKPSFEIKDVVFLRYCRCALWVIRSRYFGLSSFGFFFKSISLKSLIYGSTILNCWRNSFFGGTDFCLYKSKERSWKTTVKPRTIRSSKLFKYLNQLNSSVVLIRKTTIWTCQ